MNKKCLFCKKCLRRKPTESNVYFEIRIYCNRKCFGDNKKGKAPWNKGIKGFLAGSKHPNWKGGNSICLLCKKILTYRGASYCREHISYSKIKRGANHYAWKGGVTSEYEKQRKSSKYKLWRKAVFERDNYTCVWCGDYRGGNLNADHIKPFALFPELRFKVDNGRTLCIPCHRKTPTFGNNKWTSSSMNL